MGGKLQIQFELKIGKQYFNQDFLDIEVAKKLSIYGDKLLERLRGYYDDDARENYAELFSDKYLYECRSEGNYVVLTQHEATWIKR
jgi:hypothetical protein